MQVRFASGPPHVDPLTHRPPGQQVSPFEPHCAHARVKHVWLIVLQHSPAPQALAEQQP